MRREDDARGTPGIGKEGGSGAVGENNEDS